MSKMAFAKTLSVNNIKMSVKSLGGSVKFLKNLIPIVITNVVYNRIIYEQNLFDNHKLIDTTYTTLSRRVPKQHELFSLYHWMLSAMKSLEKKYLQRLYLIIRDKQTETVLEHYCFIIKYTTDSGITLKETEVVETTRNVFKTLNLLAEHEKLVSDNINFVMQIVLNDDAPDNYIAPNFEKGEPFVLPEKQCDYETLGNISTGYHELKMIAKMPLRFEDNSVDKSCMETGLVETNEIEEIRTNTEHGQLNDGADVEGETSERIIIEMENVDEGEHPKLEENVSVLKEVVIQSRSEDKSEQFIDRGLQKRKRKAAPKLGMSKKGRRNIVNKENIKKMTQPNEKRKFSKIVAEIDTNSSESPLEIIVESDELILPKQIRVADGVVHGAVNNTEMETQQTFSSAEVVLQETIMKEVQEIPVHECLVNDTHGSEINYAVCTELAESIKFVDELDINCLCNIVEKLTSIDLVECCQCYKYEHVTCVGQTNSFNVSKPHRCYECHILERTKNPDIRMRNIKAPEKRHLFAILRLISYYCVTTNDSPNFILRKLPLSLQKITLDNLLNFNILKEIRGEIVANIKQMKQKILNGNYFYKMVDSMQLKSSSPIYID